MSENTQEGEKSALENLIEAHTISEKENTETSENIAPQENVETKEIIEKKTLDEKPKEAEKKVEEKKSTEKTVFDIFQEDKSEKKEAEIDYKKLYEETQDKLKKYNNPVVDSLADVMNDPNFDVEKFFENYKPKDFKDIPLEDLWKMKTKSDSNVDFTDEELEELWQEEYANISDSTARQKVLKDRLISELKPKIDLGKEPEYVTNLKKATEERRIAEQEQATNIGSIVQSTMAKADELLGLTVIGDLKVTKEHVAAIKSALDPNSNHYLNQDGTFNKNKLAQERMFAVLMPDILEQHEKIVKANTRKEVYRPNANEGGENIQQEITDEGDKMIETLLKNKN
jgi:hypothetical protein